jgi:hypothetical protein
MDGWVNLDSQPLPGVDLVFDLETCRHKPIPLDHDCVDQFLVSHIAEHIVDVLPMMQELHRVAAPGAQCEIRVPYGGHDRAWEDQTHVRAYYEGSFGYFSQPHYHSSDYGYRGDWRTDRIIFIAKKNHFDDDVTTEVALDAIRTFRNLAEELVVYMTAIKPIRQAGREYMDRPAIGVQLAG